jgi:acetyltransferase (GNAT) family protein
MSAPNYLIDTNVFIRLEDPNEVVSELAALLQLASKHHVNVFVHDAAKDDIARDKDSSRQRVTLSKIEKFQSLSKVLGLATSDLQTWFGPLPKPNDIVDATLLHALKIGVADFLVTEDRGLHERARRYASNLANRVLYVADAVALLRSTYEPLQVPIPFVEEIDAHAISLSDPIFDSLREGYPEFDEWWKEKCVKEIRKCWAIVEENEIQGLIVRKTETVGKTDATLPGSKILKVCTFKVRPEQRGIKLGELLLKQVLWFALTNKFEVVYLTTYAAQTTLIDLIEYYGFKKTYTKENGEFVFEKSLSMAPIEVGDKESIFEIDRQSYPHFYVGPRIKSYGVPIREGFHKSLFPELLGKNQKDLFGRAAYSPRTPGNTIRKVYLCRANVIMNDPGSLLFFYRGLSEADPSQAITTVGIFESMTLASSTEELRRLAGGRSVYSNAQLEGFFAADNKPVKVINFLLVGHAQPVISLLELIRAGVVKKQPSQSIFGINQDKLGFLLPRFGILIGQN